MFFDYSLLATNIVLGVDGVEVSFSLYWFRVLEDHFVYNILTDSKKKKKKKIRIIIIRIRKNEEGKKEKKKKVLNLKVVKLDAVLSDFLETRKLII